MPHAQLSLDSKSSRHKLKKRKLTGKKRVLSQVEKGERNAIVEVHFCVGSGIKPFAGCFIDGNFPSE